MMSAAGHTLCLSLTSVLLWGLSFGGAPTLMLTFLARNAGKDIDVAQ